LRPIVERSPDLLGDLEVTETLLEVTETLLEVTETRILLAGLEDSERSRSLTHQSGYENGRCPLDLRVLG
jgi:hypothetical protein